MQEITIVKIGGHVLDNPGALSQFLDGFARLPGSKILVHGGGKEASRLSRAMGLEPTMLNGRRVTDAPTLDLVTMVYAGLINKRIVALLQSRGVNAVGLSGADGHSITATKRSAAPVDFGFVGDIAPSGVNTPFLLSLIGRGNIPVFCAIMHDGRGQLLNCNADSVASALAESLADSCTVNLTYCFELPGVLEDAARPESVIPLITGQSLEEMRSAGKIYGGMLPKLDNAMKSVKCGVSSVRICSSADVAGNSGTLIRP